MPQRVSPVMLLSIVIVLVLSLGLFAGAQSGGGAVGTALGQVGKPYAFGTDGPGTFSCTGLVRFALRSVGIMDAPWDHHAYLSAYPTVASPEPGDVVVYPDGAAMYVGDGTVVMANHADGQVGTYPMNSIGTPVGFARPYGGGTGGGGTGGSGAGDPAAVDPAAVDPAAVDPMAGDQAIPADQTAINPLAVDQAAPVDETAIYPLATDPALPVDPAMAVEQQGPVEQQGLVEPAAPPVEPVAPV